MISVKRIQHSCRMPLNLEFVSLKLELAVGILGICVIQLWNREFPVYKRWLGFRQGFPALGTISRFDCGGTRSAAHARNAHRPVAYRRLGTKHLQQNAPFRGHSVASSLVARRQFATRASATAFAAVRLRSIFSSSATPASKAASNVRLGLQSS